MKRRFAFLALVAILTGCSRDKSISEPEGTTAGYGDSTLFASLEVRNESGALVENNTSIADGTYTFRFRCAGGSDGAITDCIFVAAWAGCGTASELCFSLSIPFSETLGRPYQARDTVEFEFSSSFGNAGAWRMSATTLGDGGYARKKLNNEVLVPSGTASRSITSSRETPGAVTVYINGRFVRRISR